MKKVLNFLPNIEFFIAFIVVCVGAYFWIQSINNEFNDEVSIKHTDSVYVDTFSIQAFKDEIYKQNIKHPEIVLRQGILESAWFTSDIWVKNKNPFGFYYQEAYLKFETWQQSVHYYSAWQDRHYKGGDYYEFLGKIGYAEDSCYEENLRNINLNRIDESK
jgi:hypothetical protein